MTARIPRTDVLIVGAGPAGSVTALLLARHGVRVTLMDRSTFPRPKPCGDCLSAGATALLDRLGLLGRVEALGPAHLRGWRVQSGAAGFEGRFRTAGEAGAGALAIERFRLDAALVEAALDAGAELYTARVTDLRRDAAGGVRGVVGRTPGGSTVRLGARCVIGADGLRSVVARRLGLIARRPRVRKVSVTAHVDGMAHAGAVGEMHVFPGGCLGLAPVDARGDRHNLTVVLDTDRVTLPPGGAGGLLRLGIDRVPAVRERVAGLEPHGPLLASGPFDWPMRCAVADGAALVGDAAGYFDPFTGQGIYNAMAGAGILAGALAAALETGAVTATALRRYTRRQARLVRGGRRVQRLVETVVSRPRVAKPVFRALDRAPAAADALIAVTGDLRPARSLLSPWLWLSLLNHAPEIRR